MKFEIHTSHYEGFAYSYGRFYRGGFGDKEVLVFLGGAFQDIRASYKICRELSQAFDVLCIELPGAGNSDPLPETYGFGFLSNLLHVLLSQCCIESVHVIGCSYGSPIAYKLAQKYPTLVKRMVLTGVVKEIPDSVRGPVERSVSLIEAGDLIGFDNLVGKLFFNLDQKEEVENLDYIREKFSKALLEMTVKAKLKYAQNTRRLLQERLSDCPQVKIPVLVMTGEFDNFTSPEYCEDLAKMCKDCEYVLIDNADHFFHVEKPKTTIDLAREFLLSNDITKINGHSKSLEHCS